MKIVGKDSVVDVAADMNMCDVNLTFSFEEGAEKEMEVEVSASAELLTDVSEEWSTSFPLDVEPGDTSATVHKRAMVRGLRMLANMIEGVRP